jgi:galactokinase
LKNIIEQFDARLHELYCGDPDIVSYQKKRYEALISMFESRFGSEPYRVFSTPGRTEIGGNHTDHNNGKVIAASIDLDTAGAAAPNGSDTVVLYSSIYNEPIKVDCGDLRIRKEELGTTAALIRGVIHGIKEFGGEVGGFNCYLRSDVGIGSGLSSSASIEVFIGTIINVLFNDSVIGPIDIARIGQQAENVYFGKPCGLMDQIACAHGGVVWIDFKDADNPDIETIDLNLSDNGYRLLILDTGGDHANLTDEYASVPYDMRLVAAEFGRSSMREVTREELIRALPDLRPAVGERPILRALHFLDENDRVDRQKECLMSGDFTSFLSLVNASGESSVKILQNIYSPGNVLHQPVSLAIALTEEFIAGIGGGAVRIHGGGFAGTIQIFLPEEHVADYRIRMERIFGRGCIKDLRIRRLGTTAVF